MGIDNANVAEMRALLLVILVLGLLGTGTELVLLEHYEDWWQVVPLGLIGLAIIVLVWHGVTRGPASVRTLQAVMVLFLAGGATGTWLHYNGNSEFELEMDPALVGFRLFRQSMSGATPALAPGAIIHLGLIGLLYTYGHPRTRAADSHG